MKRTKKTNWTPEFAIKHLEETQKYLDEKTNFGILLHKLTDINEKLMEKFRDEYIFEKRKEFLEKIPKNLSDKELFKFKEMFFDKYYNNAQWLVEESKKTYKIEDYFTEKNILDFIHAKYGLKKATLIEIIMQS